MTYIFLLVNVLIAISLLFLALMSLGKGGYKSPINRLFTVFSVGVAVWIIATHISNDMTVSTQLALYANYVVFSSSLATVLLLLLFIVKLTNATTLESRIKLISPILWGVVLLSATPLVVDSIERQGNVYAVNYGPGIWLYSLVLFAMVAAIVYVLIQGLKSSKGTRRRQVKSIAVGLMISLPLVLLLSFIIPNLTGVFALTEFGSTPVILLVICIFYGVIRYQLFDIKLAAVRTSAYVLALLALSALYYFMAYLISVILFNFDSSTYFAFSPINVILALILAFVFQPIKHFFDRVTNFIFYRNVYDADEFFIRFSRKLSTITDFRTLINYVAEETSKTLNASFGSVLVYREQNRVAYAVTETRYKQLPKTDTGYLDEYVKRNGNTAILTDAISDSDSVTLRRLLASHKIGLVLPLVQGETIMGYVFLGDHLGSRYTARDVKTVSTIADELMIAIKNALSVQEVKELNDNLQQRIDFATKELRSSNAQLQRLDESKDEFISMASHQLRTPLTSIKGYISMLLEGDVGEVTPEQKHVLREAFVSSERMVRLIGDFLNVSRLQTGKFVIEKRPIDLARLVKRELESLASNAAARELKFDYKMPKNIPILELDENKIQQVVMNFADNALYYSKEKGKITVSLKKVPGFVEFTVKDNGIGVPKEEQAHLFNKFFRATNARKARPDGTGVGLFLARKVISEHNGSIIFESAEGKGSTFGFRLPIPKEKRKPAKK